MKGRSHLLRENADGRWEEAPTSIAFALTAFLAMPIFLSLSGTVTVYTQFGGLELVAVHAIRNADGFHISIQCWNKGILGVTIEGVDLNGIAQDVAGLPIILEPNEVAVIDLKVGAEGPFVSGNPIEIGLRASDALHHVKMVTPR